MSKDTAKSLFFLLLAGLVLFLPELGFAQSVADDAVALREAYNRELIGAIGTQFLNTPILRWETGLLQYLFAYCFIIAIFQSFLIGNERGMLMEFMRIAFCAVFALLMVGKINPRTVGLNLVGGAPPAYNYTRNPGTQASLDREVFNFLAWKFDELGDGLFGKDPSGRQIHPTEFYQEKVDKIMLTSSRLLKAKAECGAGQVQCINSVLATGEPSNEQNQAEASGGDEDGSIWDTVTGGAGAAMMAFFSTITEAIANFANPYWYLEILLRILDFIRAALTFLVLIAFGVITAMSLFFIKLFAPFLLLKSHMKRVISAAKIPMSAAMYGFLMKLVLFLSAIITDAMTTATTTTIVSKINSGASATDIVLSLGTLTISNTIAVVVITIFQIVAIAKIPKLARNLINLSFEEIVNMGEVLFSAGLGMAKLVGALALTGGAAAAGAAAGAGSGMLAKTASGQVGSALKQRAKQGLLASGAGPLGGTGPTPGGGGGGAGPMGGKVQSENAKLAGGDNISARTDSQTSVLKRNKRDEAKSRLEKEKAERLKKREELKDARKERTLADERSITGGEKSLDKDYQKANQFPVEEGGSGILLDEDKRKTKWHERRKVIADTFAGKNKAGKIMRGLGGLAWAGIETGAGGDAISGTVSRLTGQAAEGVSAGKAFETAQGATLGAKQKAKNWREYRQLKNAESAVVMNNLVESANEYTTTPVNEEQEMEIRDLLAKVEDNTATDKEMTELYKMNNRFAFSDELQSQYDRALADDTIDFGTNNKLKAEEALNARLMGRVQQRMASGKQIAGADLRQMQHRINQGLMSADMMNRMQVQKFDYANKQNIEGTSISLAQRFEEDSKNYTQHEFSKLQTKMNNNPNYRPTTQDRNVASYMATAAAPSLVGSQTSIQTAQKVLGENSELGRRLNDYQKASAVVANSNIDPNEQLVVEETAQDENVNKKESLIEDQHNFLGYGSVILGDGNEAHGFVVFDENGRGKPVTDYDQVNELTPFERDRMTKAFEMAALIVNLADNSKLGNFTLKDPNNPSNNRRITSEDVDQARALLQFKKMTDN